MTFAGNAASAVSTGRIVNTGRDHLLHLARKSFR
jgi:hypothetical protein